MLRLCSFKNVVSCKLTCEIVYYFFNLNISQNTCVQMSCSVIENTTFFRSKFLKRIVSNLGCYKLGNALG